MTAIGCIMSFANRIRALFFPFEEPAKIRNKYPLYWLAPSVDYKTRRIRIGSLLKSTSKHDRDNKTINYPIKTGIFKYLLPLLGLDPCEKKQVAVQIARLEDNFIVENGMLRLRLAMLLNLDCVAVRLREYDYLSLKKRMHIHRGPDINVAGVARKNGSGYDYYGISPAQVEVLTRSYRVPLADQVMQTAQESVAGMAQEMCNGDREVVQKHKKLVLIKK
ncbi:MAG: hypothetical protein ACOY4I_11690 [Bacillota bacterium]